MYSHMTRHRRPATQKSAIYFLVSPLVAKRPWYAGSSCGRASPMPTVTALHAAMQMVMPNAPNTAKRFWAAKAIICEPASCDRKISPYIVPRCSRPKQMAVAAGNSAKLPPSEKKLAHTHRAYRATGRVLLRAKVDITTTQIQLKHTTASRKLALSHAAPQNTRPAALQSEATDPMLLSSRSLTPVGARPFQNVAVKAIERPLRKNMRKRSQKARSCTASLGGLDSEVPVVVSPRWVRGSLSDAHSLGGFSKKAQPISCTTR
mmetsp:Transcript_27171/g.67788  ORF Transcript_27171/g.67788 Transcript_27171/m.67788 type:complete len:262 (-) Transcript_27171:652-1437(-)